MNSLDCVSYQPGYFRIWKCYNDRFVHIWTGAQDYCERPSGYCDKRSLGCLTLL
jgi:hypothetical protein